jgi:hypothetical protein
MPANLSPVFNEASFINGIPANGAQIFTYVAGSSTKLATYTDDTGTTPQANPIILNSRGEPASPIWLGDGLSYKFVFTSATDTDPPASPIRTIDDVTGVNDASSTSVQWVDSGVTPTYVSATQFTLPGDQTTAFHVNRRIKATVTAGTVYGYITASVFGALTTVTVDLDSGALDSGLSAVQLGLITYNNTSLPKINPSMLADVIFQDFRLTLTTGTPVTTADVTGATTIYCTPYVGNSISLYNGADWYTFTSSEFSIALGTLTSGRPYDVFCYDNAGVPTLELTSWTNDTTRATALAYQDGVLVKSGTATRRYLGTFYTTSTTQTEDSKTKRYLWNYYNRIVRQMLVTDAAASWTYTTAAYRQANASTANQLNFVIGVLEDAVTAGINVSVALTSSNAMAIVSIGVDSIVGPVALTGSAATSGVGGFFDCASARYIGYPGVGRHFLAWLEWSTAAGVTTWNGTSSTLNSGISGEVLG